MFVLTKEVGGGYRSSLFEWVKPLCSCVVYSYFMLLLLILNVKVRAAGWVFLLGLTAAVCFY